MNRVRKYNNKFQVLITPHHRFHAGLELMLGNWTDQNLSNFRVETYNSWEDAMDRAYQLPDINWDQLVLYHKDIYAKLFQVIKYEINVNNFSVELEPKLMNSYQIKEIMFNRVVAFGERFRLGYHMNDIISFHISDTSSSNLTELAEILSVNQALRIIFKTNDEGIIRLVGKTDIGTTYEIVLWPTLIAKWGKWSSRNPDIPNEIKMQKLKEIQKQQEEIDKHKII